MHFHDSPEDAAFRREVREFIERELPKGFDPPDEEAIGLAVYEGEWVKEWNRKLAQRGWAAPAWPKEYGGGGMTIMQQFIFNEEMGRARVPQGNFLGVGVAGPVIILFGNDEQKREHLPPMLTGEVIWCQGFSEPGAGSDLASLQTRALRNGDDYIINGHKMWSSAAHRAGRMLLLARTDPNVPKHKGISAFLVDMKSPGLTVKPIENIAGERGFNEVFLDNVRVPKKDLLGQENQGWQIAVAALNVERSGISQGVRLRGLVEDILAFVGDWKADGRHPDEKIRYELADRYLETELAHLLSLRTATVQAQGQIPIREASQTKLYGSELAQRIAATGMHLLGLYGQLAPGSRWAPLAGRIERMYVLSLGSTLASGSSEIQRNVIATRGLGLPRGE